MGCQVFENSASTIHMDRSGSWVAGAASVEGSFHMGP